MKRPLVMFALFLAGGILFSRSIYPFAGLIWLVIASAAISAGLWFFFKQKIVLIFPLFALLGFFLLQNSITDSYEVLHEIAAERGNVEFTGVITSVSRTRRGRTTAVVRTGEFHAEDGVFPARVRVLAYLGVGDEAEVGSEVVVSGNLQALRFRRNPGAYDEFTFLRTRKIEYTIFPDTFEQSPPGFHLSVLPSLAASRLQETIRRVLPEYEANILIGMLLGDRTGMSDETLDTFREAGVFHILAVSGLHVSILALSLKNLLMKLKLNPRTAGAVTLGFLMFYCLMTGAGPGTVRAVVMAGTYIVGALFYKRGDSLVSTSFAAVVLLIYEPLFLWDVGFQFSFGAVYSLILVTPVITRLFHSLAEKYSVMKRLVSLKYVRNHVPAVFAATLAAIPVQSFYFYEFPLVGFLSNLIIVPTLVITVSAGFFVGLVGQLSVGVAGLFAVVPQFLVRLYMAVTDFFASLPFAMQFTGRPRIIVVIVYIAVILVIVRVLKLKQLRYSKIRGKRIIQGALLAFILTLVISAAVPAPLTVTMLDVGQGSAVMVSRGGQAFLIDGGGRSLDRLGGDTGVWTVMPYMDYLGITTLCAAFVSSSHPRNAIGVIEVIEQGRVRAVYLSYMENSHPEVPEVIEALLTAAYRTGTRVDFIGAGDVMEFYDNVTVNVLYPTAGSIQAGLGNSLVKILDAGGVRFLFPGGISAAAERELLLLYGETSALRADVLKLSADGAGTSNTSEFLATVGPALAINSSAAWSPPALDVVEQLYNAGIPLFRTDTQGAARLFPRNNEIRVITMEDLADERTKRPLKIR